MIRFVPVLFLLIYSLNLKAENLCVFKGQSESYTGKLTKTCELFFEYCTNFSSKEKSCIERMDSTQVHKNHREQSYLNQYRHFKHELTEEIFVTVDLKNKSITESDVKFYESKLNQLDTLSRSSNNIMREFILDLSNNLQQHWMNEYYHAWAVWQNQHSDLFKSAGIPLSLITGQVALYKFDLAATFSRLVNKSLPMKFFLLSSEALKLSTPLLTLEGVKSINPEPLIMPVSPAHMIRFDYKNVTEEDFNAIVNFEKSQNFQNQIRTATSASVLFALGNTQIKSLQVLPSWVPQWIQNFLKSKVTSGPSKLNKFSPKDLIRISPYSLLASILVDQSLAAGFKFHSENEIAKQILQNSTDLDPAVQIQNARTLMTTLAGADIFYSSQVRAKYYAIKEFISDTQYAMTHQLPLHLFMDEYFANHFEVLKLNESESLRNLSCLSIKSINYTDVGRRSIKDFEEKFNDTRSEYLNSLWSFMNVLLENKSKIDKNSLGHEIINNKFLQVRAEYETVRKQKFEVNFKNWSYYLFNNWFLPVSKYFTGKKHLSIYGFDPNAKNINDDLANEFESLSYCQLSE
jgi:hypothetical protein